jgi:retinol dehydrogenase-12
MMARSEEKTKKAIDDIKTAVPTSKGELIFLPLDLADLESVKASAEEFLRREKKLHILFNNAGVGYPGKGSKSKQGFELQLGVNCIGTFAFTEYLTPTIVSTAKASPSDTVRVVWVSSSAAEAVSPKGFVENLADLEKKNSFNQYCISKLGGYLYSSHYANLHRADGVLSISLNPGNLDSDFWRTQGSLMTWALRKFVLYPTVFGAYTALFAGFSPEVTLEKSGSFSEYSK